MSGSLSRAVREGGIRSTLMALLFFLLLADSSWVILFREFERLVMILSVPQKGKSKNGVAPALESHRPTPTTATPAFVGDPGREPHARVGHPLHRNRTQNPKREAGGAPRPTHPPAQQPACFYLDKFLGCSNALVFDLHAALRRCGNARERGVRRLCCWSDKVA